MAITCACIFIVRCWSSANEQHLLDLLLSYQNSAESAVSRSVTAARKAMETASFDESQ